MNGSEVVGMLSARWQSRALVSLYYPDVSLSITWLGHSTFIITTPGGKRIVTDPWLEGNPMCPPDKKRIDKADVILLSHGHSDHSGDVVSVARATGAPVVAIYELSMWLTAKGLQNVMGMGIGGTVTVAGLEITMVPAVHTQQRRRERRHRLSRVSRPDSSCGWRTAARSTSPGTRRSSATCV